MDELGDRERITQYVMRELATGFGSAGNLDVYEASGWDEMRVPIVHPARYRKPIPGDLVLAVTARENHRWILSWHVEALPDIGGALVREIGSNDTCRYGNEAFLPIVGVPVGVLYESHTGHRQFYLKVLAAFRKGGSYWHRFGGLRFDGDAAEIRVRKAFSGDELFTVRMNWSKRTPIRVILAALCEAGYDPKS